jgi:hypothetical protein
MSTPSPSMATSWENLRHVRFLYHLGLCSQIQSVSPIARLSASRLVAARATLLRADPAHPGRMAAAVAASEKVARYIFKLDIDGRVAITVYYGPEEYLER